MGTPLRPERPKDCQTFNSGSIQSKNIQFCASLFPADRRHAGVFEAELQGDENCEEGEHREDEGARVAAQLVGEAAEEAGRREGKLEREAR